MKLTKQDTRLRRARRGRVKIKELAALRLLCGPHRLRRGIQVGDLQQAALGA